MTKTAIVSIDLRTVTGDTMDEITGDKVLAVRDMEASPAVIAALLRKAADDLDPPRSGHLPGHGPGCRCMTPRTRGTGDSGMGG